MIVQNLYLFTNGMFPTITGKLIDKSATANSNNNTAS